MSSPKSVSVSTPVSFSTSPIDKQKHISSTNRGSNILSYPKSNNCNDSHNFESSFDILSKWYIDGELEIQKNLADHEKSELVKEIKRLGQKYDELNKVKTQNEKKLRMYIESLESKVNNLENDKIKLNKTILNLEKSLLGDSDWYAEKDALNKALIDFTNGLKK